MALDALLESSANLERLIDALVEDAGDDIWAQCQADWAWFRFASANVLVRDRGGGTVAASLARGLLEEAAYWDWTLATGVGSNWVARRAAAEYQRLVEVARTANDDIWLGWVLPPGSRVVTVSSEEIPAHAGDAVKRIGNGLESPVLAPLTRYKKS